MTDVKFHCFYVPGTIPEYVVERHKKVCEKFKLNVVYHPTELTEEQKSLEYPGFSAHGEFMDKMMETSDDEIVAFIDIDLLPTNSSIIDSIVAQVKISKTFAGNAQNISHNYLLNQIYVAPSFIIIHKECWEKLGKPSLKYRDLGDGVHIDTAMEITIRANQVGCPYVILLPNGFDGDAMKLGPYGYYGYSCHYPGTWHLMRVSDIEKNENLKSYWFFISDSLLEGDALHPKYKSIPYNFTSFIY